MRPLISCMILLSTFFGTIAFGETISCDAFAGLNRYHMEASVDTESRSMTLTMADGSIYSGVSTYSKSGRTGREYYFLATTFEQGFEVMVDTTNRNWLCIKNNECYSCK